MPEASDIQTLYQVEQYVEQAFETVLEDVGLTVHQQRDTATLSLPFAAVRLSLGTASDQLYYNTVESKWYDQLWENSQLQITLISDRLDTTQQGTTHREWLGKLRKAMSEYATGVTTTELPYHGLSEVRAGGTFPELDLDKKHDVSRIVYNIGAIGILPAAWPSS
jgi:hypothetical protein